MIKSLNLNLIKKLRVIAPRKHLHVIILVKPPFTPLESQNSLLFFDIATKIRMIYMYIYRDEKMDGELILWIL